MKRNPLALAAAVALPLAALAQGTPPPAAGAPAERGGKPAAGRDQERLESRMRLARTLGLAEALDLDAQHALKLGDQLTKFDDRRVAAQKQLREAHRALRDAADAESPTAQQVDQAIQKALDARAQLAAIDRETLQVVSKDLSPAQRARAVLFLDRFQKRFRGLGPDRDEIRKVMKQRGRMHGEHGRRGGGFAFRMEGPGDFPGLAMEAVPLPPPPDAFLFEGGDDDEDLEIELERL